MNNIMRKHLYGEIDQKYVTDEILLVTNYMTLPELDTKQLMLIEIALENNNKSQLNYIFNKLINNNLKTNMIDSLLVDTFKDINKKDNKIKLYTSCSIKVIKIVEKNPELVNTVDEEVIRYSII